MKNSIFFYIFLIFLIYPNISASNWPVPRSIKCNSSGTFQCTTPGQYEDPFDSSCKLYYICREGENYFETLYLACLPGTWYDPVKEECTEDYKCVCEEDGTLNWTVISGDPCDACSECDHSSTSSSSGSTLLSTTPSSDNVPYCSVGGVFNCTKTGRFADPNDSTCKSYYYCYVWNSDGQLRYYPYSCSIGVFNPNTGSCDLNYECPCSGIISTSTSIETISSEPSSTTSEQSGSTSVPSSTVSPPPYCSVGGVFNCTETGRFADPNDSTCKSYYYCYVWNSDGQLRYYPYTCSIGVFNPNTGTCDLYYECPCSGISSTSTSIETTSSEPSSSTSEQSSTISEPFSTTSEPFSTVSPPPYCSVGGIFNCTETGRFADPNDSTCKSYYYCYVWNSDGQLRYYPYSCSIGVFNPNTGTCDLYYECPCSGISSTSTSIETTSFEPSSSTSEQSSTPSEPFSTTSEPFSTVSPPPYCSVGGIFNCTETGRFADPNDSTCKSYYYCYVWNSDGQLRYYPYTCSIGVFNPNTGTCDLYYECPCSGISSTSSSIETTSSESSSTTFEQSSTTSEPFSTTSEAFSTVSPPPYCSVGGIFNCTETGRFADPNDSTCKSYYYCYVWNSDGQLRYYPYSCSLGVFNPNTGSCDLDYECPCSGISSISTSIDTTSSVLSSTTSLPDSTVSTTTTEIPSTSSSPYCSVGGIFNCTKTGRYADPNDSTCKSYYYCYVWNSDGELRYYPYTCSIGLFNPSTGSCDLDYQCPCSNNNNTVPRSSSSTSLSSSTQAQSSSISTSTEKPYCLSGGKFSCTKVGKFANPNDKTCKKFYYCIGSPSFIGKLSLTCISANFNPETQKCDSNYSCPCS
ncbi:nuclear pore complex protein DDB_G0274915-like isoform X2 [Sitophilus oryzae]|uniref:Nuclear pore complex protein DDB_G0274915-like isoform X2 n=1 Tax=Sitophilus oryzae TaxID=7048 RepID=A0A6J2X4S5_SITOR|nr:nuclear pore complex protein DDB_G0274915-like isoform X2 [Sitophilus oryzae]